MSRSTEGLHAVSAVRRSTLGRRRGRRRAGRLAGLRLPCGAAPGASCSGIPAARGRGPPLGQGRAVRGGPERLEIARLEYVTASPKAQGVAQRCGAVRCRKSCTF